MNIKIRLLVLMSLIVACATESSKQQSFEITNTPKNAIITFIEDKSRILYTGVTKMTENYDERTGIYIKKLNYDAFEYKFDQLVNWKEKLSLAGKATFYGTDSSNYFGEELTLHYILKDSMQNVEILLNQRNCLLKKDDEQVSALMYRK